MHAPFTISRFLKAPRSLVWEVYSSPEHLQHWLGPKGSTVTHSALDFRVGGTYHYAMQIEGGPALWGKWQLQEIVPPEKLVLIQCFSDPAGGSTRNPWAAGWPLYTHSTTTLSEQDGGTLLSLVWAPHEATAEEQALFASSHASMTQGWSGNFDVLEDYLSLLQTR
ncbi:SRPBCC family protein [Rhodoferax bucti]|uniref:SRPBCC family protein n=1 Tax=Rhodoferax bucti TaxID=2576305 RepID=UPI00110878B4|nr:SRPBCC domain-containing protein [Rhodoferax bucti]